ncbi:MAG: ATP-binding cassette domain-containing protein [Steroidobacteraceae bacterium]
MIETIGLTRRFGPLASVDSASLSMQSREISGLIGPDGAGKSTLIKMPPTRLAPSSGHRTPRRFRSVLTGCPDPASYRPCPSTAICGWGAVRA